MVFRWAPITGQKAGIETILIRKEGNYLFREKNMGTVT
jgi:hypothetical protein